MEVSSLPNAAPTHTANVPPDLAELLKSSDTAHPALARLKSRLSATSPVEAIITSYDRLHHRHNRS
jgi:hypothetical protein